MELFSHGKVLLELFPHGKVLLELFPHGEFLIKDPNHVSNDVKKYRLEKDVTKTQKRDNNYLSDRFPRWRFYQGLFDITYRILLRKIRTHDYRNGYRWRDSCGCNTG